MGGDPASRTTKAKGCGSMKETFSRALGALDRARNEVSCRVEATAVGAKDAVINRTNQITGTVAKTYYGVKGTVS